MGNLTPVFRFLSLAIILNVLKPHLINGQLFRSVVKREAKAPDAANILETLLPNPISDSALEFDGPPSTEYEDAEIESEKLDGLTNPEDYFIWWLPGINKLGLELDMLKMKISLIYLQSLYKLKTDKNDSNNCNISPATNADQDVATIYTNLQKVEFILKNMTAISSSIKLIRDSQELENFDDGIPTVLSQSIDTLGIRSKASTIIESVANLVKTERENKNKGCQWSNSTQTIIDKLVDDTINDYWLRVIPIASSVFWDEYTEKDKENLIKLIKNIF